ncbi:MAG: Coenzyme F420 hydrogenase/dehydrogenase, beta subunit C-terminal domain [Thomasclavelia sp.]
MKIIHIMKFIGKIHLCKYFKDLCLRPSCYDCHSKSLHRNSDITLADFWGIKEVCSEMYDNKGTSLVFINSDKGK